MSRERYFSYAIVRCADEQRDEALNVGVIVYDADSQQVTVRFADNLTRVRRTLPGVSVPHLRVVLAGVEDHLQRLILKEGPRALSCAHHQWQNVLRISPVRSLLATNIHDVSQALYRRYVAAPERLKHGTATSEPTRSAPTSMRLVRSLAVRLRRRGVDPVDMVPDAEVQGLTSSGIRVPVWFPLALRTQLFFDAIDIKTTDERGAFDAARLMGQKAEETLRARAGSVVSVTVRESHPSGLGERISKVIEHEGAVGGVRPLVHLIHSVDELDAVVSDLPGQREIFDSNQ